LWPPYNAHPGTLSSQQSHVPKRSIRILAWLNFSPLQPPAVQNRILLYGRSGAVRRNRRVETLFSFVLLNNKWGPVIRPLAAADQTPAVQSSDRPTAVGPTPAVQSSADLQLQAQHLLSNHLLTYSCRPKTCCPIIFRPTAAGLTVLHRHRGGRM
jgi:hypothetical protein